MLEFLWSGAGKPARTDTGVAHEGPAQPAAERPDGDARADVRAEYPGAEEFTPSPPSEQSERAEGPASATAEQQTTAAYDTQGNPCRFTSYADAGTTTVVNQVQRSFNGLGQLTAETQIHPAGQQGTVQYTYSNMLDGQGHYANHSRPTGLVYRIAGRLRTATARRAAWTTPTAADFAVEFQEPMAMPILQKASWGIPAPARNRLRGGLWPHLAQARPFRSWWGGGRGESRRSTSSVRTSPQDAPIPECPDCE
jgi:hypothetical protein